MKKRSVVLALILVIVGLGGASFAATEYVVTNDDYVFANSASVYELNTTTGVLKLVTVLETGGLGMPQGFAQNNVLDVEQAISPSAACVFVLDPQSNDIASFSKALNYAEVGRYSNSAVNSSYNGGSLALTPNGKFMYVSYSGSQNLGAWTVNPDCSLTFIAAYVPSEGSGPFSTLRVSPNSSYLVVPYGSDAELFTIDQNSGVLTDIGFVSYTLTTCRSYPSCLPTGIDFTRDSKIVIFGNGASYPSALTAEITPNGLVQPRAWSLPSPQRLIATEYPFLSAAGYAGSGSLYFGASETNPPKQYHAGILTTNFTEEPLSITVTNGTVIDPPNMIDCAIAVTGDLMVIAQYYNQIAVFKINPDGTVTQLSTTTDSHAGSLFSLSVFPNTR
jgi:hypothetical protein